MDHDDPDGFHNIDDGAVGGEVADAREQHSSVFDSVLGLDICQRLKLLKLCWKDQNLLSRRFYQERGYFPQAGNDRCIHPHGDVQPRPDSQSHPWPDSQSYPSSREEEISIGARKHLFLSRNDHGRAQTRIIEAEQEQKGAPSCDVAHAILPSESYDLFRYFNFWSVLTSLYYNSESRAVYVCEMNSSTASDAYCFGNSFVCMNALSGSTVVPILRDSALIENAVASADDGHDEDHFEGGTIPFQK